jgi:transposase-like protein
LKPLDTCRTLSFCLNRSRRDGWKFLLVLVGAVLGHLSRRSLPECGEIGASVSAVARRHGLTPQQLFGWRRDAQRKAKDASAGGTAFARAIMESSAPISPAGRKSRPIEVVIGAMTVRVPPGTDTQTLEMVLRAARAVA